MSEVVTHGLRQYVQRTRHPDGAGRPGTKPPASDPGGLVLPDRVAAWLRELRSSGRSELLVGDAGRPDSSGLWMPPGTTTPSR